MSIQAQTKKVIIIAVLSVAAFFIAGYAMTKVFAVPVLSISPTRFTLKPGETITMDIVVNTGGIPIDGFDIRYLRYDPTLIEIEDADTQTPGIQLENKKVFLITAINSVDQEKGTIAFSQMLGGGISISQKKSIVAHIHLKAKAPGKGSISFDFRRRHTTDANISSNGRDILQRVQNATYEIR